MYPKYSKAGTKTDYLPNIKTNTSIELWQGRPLSLQLNYMHDIAKDYRKGGALMGTFKQVLSKPKSKLELSAQTYFAYGTGLYEYKGLLLVRPGIELGKQIGKKGYFSLKSEYQIAGKNQKQNGIPNKPLIAACYSINF